MFLHTFLEVCKLSQRRRLTADHQMVIESLHLCVFLFFLFRNVILHAWMNIRLCFNTHTHRVYFSTCITGLNYNEKVCLEQCPSLQYDHHVHYHSSHILCVCVHDPNFYLLVTVAWVIWISVGKKRSLFMQQNNWIQHKICTSCHKVCCTVEVCFYFFCFCF